jgi:hypothetical protein
MTRRVAAFGRETGFERRSHEFLATIIGSSPESRLGLGDGLATAQVHAIARVGCGEALARGPQSRLPFGMKVELRLQIALVVRVAWRERNAGRLMEGIVNAIAPEKINTRRS